MSCIIPFLSFPFGFAFQAYKSASFELPLVKQSLFFSQRVYKGDPDYNTTLKRLPGNRVKEEIQPFLDKEKIRKDLIVVETPNLGICAAEGTNLFKKGDAVVMLAPGFHNKDKEACHWVIKHEISHIKNNDPFTIPLIGAISSMAAAVFGTLTMSRLSATLLTAAVGLTAFSLFSQWREGKADDFAIKNSSDDELLGGRRFFMAFKEMNLHERKTFWKKIEITSYGNNTFDVLHPSLTSRIEKIEKLLEKKGIVINKEVEAREIENLKLFIIDKKSEIEKAVANAGGILGILKQMYTL
jgi:hypothetical protein